MKRQTAALDPRTKLVLAFVYAGILGGLDHWPLLLLAAGFLIALALSLGLTRAGLKFLRGLGPAVLGFSLIAWLAFDGSLALTAGSRLLALAMVFFLFFQTTSPRDLSRTLVRMGMPYAVSFVLTVSLEFIPVLARRAANIRDAQRARGIPVGGGWRGLRYLPALLGPLLIQAFKLAEELAEALEARGFGSPGHRRVAPTPLSARDWLILVLSLGGLLAWLAFRYCGITTS